MCLSILTLTGSTEELQMDRLIDYLTFQFFQSTLTLTGSNEDLQVDRVIDYLTIRFVFVYSDADWVN